MQTTVKFVPVQEQHVEQIVEIYNYYVLHTTVSFHTEPLTMDEMRAQLFDLPAQYCSYAIVEHTAAQQTDIPQQQSIRNREKSALLGYILLTRHKAKQAYDTTAEITIYLKPDQSGKGIGSRALVFIEQAARQHGFHVLVATVCADNMSSMRLFERYRYEKCAHFREVGRKFDRWLDIVSYQKIIGRQGGVDG
ncbi:GNAT family N-acetyltransferase [Paenibacillus campi]|uniref:GNAT family N-acetyltransferase n=1 Tax=Paenibacillus campi TaxID=3106031 RepID=UPI002AFE99BB|nr:GNAT family N-acetyltransferase [Paenibacillus sp. SGZ-1014]